TSPLGILLLTRTHEKLPPLAWVATPTFHDICKLFYSLAGNAMFIGAPKGRGIGVVAVHFVACLIALFSGVKMWRSSGRSFDTWRLGLLLSWLFVPIVLALAVSLVKPIFVTKYLIVCLPALILLSAKGIDSLRPRWLASTG